MATEQIKLDLMDDNTEQTEQTSVAVQEKETPLNPMDMAENSNINAFQSLASFKEAFTLGKYLAMSDLAPQVYKNNPANCAIAVDISNRMGVSPMFVMQNLNVVRGIPSWSGQACISLIRACGRFKGAKPVYTGDIGKENRTCHFEAVEIATGETVVGTVIDWQMIKSEGWDKNSKWKSMTEQMMAYRAATFFARVYCPNELMGFKVEGEAEDSVKEVPKATDVFAEIKGEK